MSFGWLHHRRRTRRAPHVPAHRSATGLLRAPGCGRAASRRHSPLTPTVPARESARCRSCVQAVTASWAIVGLAQLAQVDSQVASGVQGVRVILAQDPAAAVQGVLVQIPRGPHLAQLAQVVGQDCGGAQRAVVVLAQDPPTADTGWPGSAGASAPSLATGTAVEAWVPSLVLSHPALVTGGTAARRLAHGRLLRDQPCAGTGRLRPRGARRPPAPRSWPCDVPGPDLG